MIQNAYSYDALLGSAYKFTGKERDCESNFHYFGGVVQTSLS